MDKFTFKERMLLTTGNGAWHTHAIEDKLPKIMLCDGPHGLRKQDDGKNNNDSIPATCFPTASALACSFDTRLVSLVAESIAKEAFNEDVSVLLGPGINMKRSPTCGRNFEYFSEDPFLTGKLASAYVKSAQSIGVATCLKHFACNSQETKRMIANSVVDLKALHSIYLKAFEMVVKDAKPASIMASYNRINNEYACENKYLLTDVLRNSWGFNGAVISDWGASINLTKSLNAGLSLEMPSSGKAHLKLLNKDLEKGLIKEETVVSSSNDVINLVNKYAIENRQRKHKYTIANNHTIAVTASEESAVLLKNDGILPLKTKNVTIIGGLAQNIRYQGGGSSHINTLKVKDPVIAFKEGGYQVNFAKGYIIEKDTDDTSLINEAIELAKKSQVIIFYGGLTDIFEGEGFDRKSYSMPNNQINLLNKLYEINSNIIFISFQGSPYDMESIQKCRAILSMYLSGEGVSEAIVNLLSGVVNPSGKLAESIPFKLEDTPAFNNYATGNNDVPYKESIFIGYRYYDTFNVPVRYPFGYGLSYTKFDYSNLDINKVDTNTFDISFDVTNTGLVFGKEIVQIYIKANRVDYLHPNRELRGFDKVALNSKETKRVTIRLNKEAFEEYDINLGWITPKDHVEIQVSSSLMDTKLSQVVEIEGTDEITNEAKLFPIYADKNRKLKDITDEEFELIYGSKMKSFNQVNKGEFTMANSLSECAKYSLKAKLLLKIGLKVIYSQFKNKPKDDPEVMMMTETIKDGTLDCVLIQGGIPYRIGESIILSCNKHRFKALIKLIGG